jgi:hypothetical protein
MFCPKCRYEYNRGIYKCPECEVDLVEKLPDKTKNTPNENGVLSGNVADNSDLSVVYEPGSMGDLILAKAILDEERIEYYVFDTLVHYGVRKRPAVMVKTEDAERAKQLLIDIANSRVDEADGNGTKS